jgi:hypothetical protein
VLVRASLCQRGKSSEARFFSEADAAVNKLRARQWAARIFVVLLTVAAIAFFVDALLAVHRQGALGWPAVHSWAWLLASVLVGVAPLAVMSRALHWLMGADGFCRVLSVFLFSQSAKYVPGKFWGVVAQHALMGEDSKLSRVVGANIALAAILLATQVALAGAAIAFLRFGIYAAIVVAFLGCVLAGLGAAMLQRVHQARAWLVLAPWARPGVGFVTWAASFSTLLLTALVWAMLFAGALGYPAADVASWIAVASASFVAGMLSVLPGGLGIREAAFVALGSSIPALDAGNAPMLALFTRAWMLAIDAAAIAIGFAGLLLVRARNRK